MNYAAEAYENPPAPVPAAVETNTLGGEMFEDPKRPELPTKQPMSIQEAIMAAHGRCPPLVESGGLSSPKEPNGGIGCSSDEHDNLRPLPGHHRVHLFL